MLVTNTSDDLFILSVFLPNQWSQPPSQCSPPAMGTQGHIWLVLFSQGFVGAALFFWFLLRRVLPYVHDRDPFAIA